ncbi:MAG: LarC family nickel insertion protein, partial [Acetatifactor sp.]|nr:LarC family nickel insertion protein [Acetatifactor sp.]
MRTLYIDCGMGAAGDMLSAALLELLPNPDEFMEKIKALHIPDVDIKREKMEKCGIIGTHMTVTVRGVEEDEDMHEHGHEHSHEHDHDHH